jgi:tripartite-type tricarboxylate transporter receptor subunit TctC
MSQAETHHPRRRHRLAPRLQVLALALAATSWTQGALTADFPTESIRLVVPYTAGGATDSVARIVAQQLTQRLGQTVVVDNRPGAGGNIGTQFVATALPDGYTLLFATTANAINESLYKKLPFDFRKDFLPVSQLVELPNVLITNNQVPYKSVQELIAAAKAKPEALSYASAGTGTSTHLAAELFKSMAKVEILHVAYKGSAPAMTDLRGGRVQLMFDNLPSALAQIKAGTVRPLGVTGLQRSPQLPDVPTIATSGVPDYVAVAWHGIAAPARTPADIVSKLSTEIGEVLRMPEVVKQIEGLGAVPVSSTPEQFRRHIDKEIVKWGKVVQSSGATVD